MEGEKRKEKYSSAEKTVLTQNNEWLVYYTTQKL